MADDSSSGYIMTGAPDWDDCTIRWLHGCRILTALIDRDLFQLIAVETMIHVEMALCLTLERVKAFLGR